MHTGNKTSNFCEQDSGLLESSYSENTFQISQENQREKDLELLIRAHQKMRMFEEENTRLRQENENLLLQLNKEKQQSQTFSLQNSKLKQMNKELLTQVLRVQKLLNQNQLRQSDDNFAQEKQKLLESYRKENIEAQFSTVQINQFKQDSKSSQRNSKRILKPSESTPVILNINFNTLPREQRNSFLSSSKQQFSQEQEKIRKFSKNKQVPRNNSQYCGLDYQHKTSHTSEYGYNNFLRQAEKEFENQNQKTLNNTYYMDRKKSTSSGSLVKRNSIINIDTKGPKVFGDRINLVNSKYSSFNQTSSNNATIPSSFYKPSLNHLKLDSTNYRNATPNDHPFSQEVQIEQNLVKKANKSLYYTGQFSKSPYCSKGKRIDMRDRKKKETEMDLMNQNTNGLIKYRGLCL